MHPEDQSWLYKSIVEKHDWLTQVGELLYIDQQSCEDKNNHQTEQNGAPVDMENHIDFRASLKWDQQPSSYTGSAEIPPDVEPPQQWKFSQEQWQTFIRYSDLRWKVDPEEAISYTLSWRFFRG